MYDFLHGIEGQHDSHFQLLDDLANYFRLRWLDTVFKKIKL